MAKSKRERPVFVENITQTILLIRGQRVILDAELAALYGVTTRRLNEQVKRNAARFPEDFLFRLTAEEAAVLRSQIATSNTPPKGGRGSTRFGFYPVSTDRFVILVITRAAVRDGRVLACAGARRHYRGKGEDSGARKARGWACFAGMAASICRHRFGFSPVRRTPPLT
jgi:hypothetical protein